MQIWYRRNIWNFWLLRRKFKKIILQLSDELNMHPTVTKLTQLLPIQFE